MIEKHKIKFENNEEVLYLYMDFSYEFATLSKYSKPIFRTIKDYIDRIKKDFHGTKVVIVTSGIIIATLTLNVSIQNKPKPEYDNNLYITSIHFENPNIVKESTVEKLETKDTISKKEEKTNDIQQKETTNKETKTQTTNKSNSNTEVKKEEVKTSVKEETKQEEPSKEEVKTGTYIKVYRSNGTVLDIELEEYLIGVVGAEMPASFNTEALKAQALLARTYALKTVSQNKKLTDTVSTQAYNDNTQLKSKWGSDYTKYYNKIKSAVDATKGKTIKYNGAYIEAVYHAMSNGYTEDAKNVWGNSFPYLKVVDSSQDKNVKAYEAQTFKSYSELKTKLGINIDSSSEVNIERNTSNRVSKIKIGDNTYTGVQFRNKLGLRSADFDIEKVEEGFRITTRGSGHGVGMSQYGANEMAKTGKNYVQIINHYYPGVKIT